MPQVLLYEFLTGGGLLGGTDGPNNDSLRREGAAMLAGVAADFAATGGVQTTVILDARFEARAGRWTRCRIVPVSEPGGDRGVLAEHCRDVDWTVVIAPELDGLLESRLRIVEAAGGRLLGPSSRLAALCADKQRTAEHLTAAGVPVAVGYAVEAGAIVEAVGELGFPAVVKPRDGAGSQDIWLLADSAAAERLGEEFAFRDKKSLTPGPSPASGEGRRPPDNVTREGRDCRYRLERFYPGIAASVAVLGGPAGLFPLPACRQRLSADGRFRYLGGVCPLEPALADRAARLALRAIESLADPLGYLGVDMVLGVDPNGRDDVVIEINPRLTTSYVGLRAVAASNLASTMLDVAESRPPELNFGDHVVEFDSDGSVRL